MIPRYAEPMCGWPHDVDLCDIHNIPYTVCDCVPGAWDPETCHCGEPVRYGYDDNPEHHRGMCEHCDSVRCDAYPGECGRR